MAKSRREEPEGRIKRQRSGIRKEGGDEFKASPTRGRLKKEIVLRPNGRDEEQVNVREDGERPKQPD
jgi:hypothetical protein